MTWQLLMGSHQRQMYSNTGNITTAGDNTATYKPHGHKKSKLLACKSFY